MKPIETEQYFGLSAGHYCGVIVNKKAMKKILKLNNKYNTELRNLLASLKDDIVSSDWTMETSENKNINAVYCKFKSEYSTIESRISLFRLPQPELINNYLGNVSRDVANKWCKRKIKEAEKELLK